MEPVFVAYLPDAHAMQLTAPTVSEYVPIAHEVQLGAAMLDKYAPAEQLIADTVPSLTLTI